MALYKRSAEEMDYVEDVLEISSVADPDRYQQCLDTMDQYETPWWRELRGNLIALANMQIDQPILLITWKDFIEGVELVIGRKLEKGELSSSNTKLIEEFHQKYAEKYAEV